MCVGGGGGEGGYQPTVRDCCSELNCFVVQKPFFDAQICSTLNLVGGAGGRRHIFIAAMR